MPEEMIPATQVAKKNPGHRFPEGHPRFGGKKKNTAAAARAMASELGCDPLEFMMKIINADTIEQTVIVDGKRKRVEVTIPLDTRAAVTDSVGAPSAEASACSGCRSPSTPGPSQLCARRVSAGRVH
jgi:hypothetical protein